MYRTRNYKKKRRGENGIIIRRAISSIYIYALIERTKMKEKKQRDRVEDNILRRPSIPRIKREQTQ